MTPSNLPFGVALTGSNAGEWAVAILNEIPAPITNENVYSLAGWFLREGGGGENNPMNSTLGSQYPAINHDLVRDYPTWEVGVVETIATLKMGYSAIIDAFKAGVGLHNPSAAVAAELREWSGGGYSSISLVVVPFPAPPLKPSYHYDRFDSKRIVLPHGSNSERNVVQNYDLQRPHPLRNRKSLRLIEENLAFLANRIRDNEQSSHDLKGDKYWRAWRYKQVLSRSHGNVVEPTT